MSNFRHKVFIILLAPLTLSVFFIIPQNVKATNYIIPKNNHTSNFYITAVTPLVFLPGDRIIIDGNNFGDKKGNIYIGTTRFPYYGYSIESWTDSQIILATKADNKISSGQIGVQKWEDERLSEIVYGPELSLKPVVRNVVKKINDSDLGATSKWYLGSINANQAQADYKGSRDVVVAIIDDGIYSQHPDLKDNLWINSDEIASNHIDDDKNGFVDDRSGWNFAYNTSDMNTSGTHGTMVAGIIGASSASNFVSGLNSQVSLMPIIVSDKSGSINPMDIKRAIHYAVDNGADVINLSLGSALNSFSQEFDEAMSYAYNHNVVLVVAAGNGDIDTGLGQDLGVSPMSPVCNDVNQNMILGVGSTDKNGRKTKWSNYGVCVDVYAPGVDITSTAVPSYATSALYKSGSGTSFSTPMVSGTAALIKSRYPGISNKEIINGIIGNSQISQGLKLLDVFKAISQTSPDSTYVYSALDDNADNQTRANDKNQQYIFAEKQLLGNIDRQLSKRLAGKILLQVEEHGEAWYVFPDNGKKYYLGTVEDAYLVMKKLGLGAKHDFIVGNKMFPKYTWGKILLDVESKGEAYYINPQDGRAYYMKDGQAAYDIMRNFGLGISNKDLRSINIGEI